MVGEEEKAWVQQALKEGICQLTCGSVLRWWCQSSHRAGEALNRILKVRLINVILCAVYYSNWGTPLCPAFLKRADLLARKRRTIYFRDLANWAAPLELRKSQSSPLHQRR